MECQKWISIGSAAKDTALLRSKLITTAATNTIDLFINVLLPE